MSESAHAQPRWTRGDWLAAGLIVLAGWWVYWPALRGTFLWDDEAHVTRPMLQSVEGLVRIWTEVGATQQFYPLLHSAFWLEHRCWGDNPIGYHAVSLSWHLGAACLLGAWLRRLRLPGAWLAAAAFAVHPVAVESVAWISEQKNTLSLLLALGAALAYTRFEARRSAGAYAGAALLFAAALLTKTITATLPAVLLVVGWWKRGALDWRRDVRPLVPWLVVGALAGLGTAWVERSVIGADGAEFGLTGVQRVLLAGRVVWFYVGKLIWPANLTFIYPRWEVGAEAAAWWWWVLLAAAVTAALWSWRRLSRGPLAAWLIFVGVLLPVLGFFNVYPFRYSYVADHWQYHASTAWFALAAAGLCALAGGRGNRRAQLLGLAAVAVLALQSRAQARAYAEPAALWHVTLARNPACWLARHHLGMIAVEQGRADDALVHLGAVLQARPDDPDELVNYGSALLLAGRSEEAVAHFRRALRLKPDLAQAHVNLGNAYFRAGRYAEAVRCYARATRLEPELAIAHNNLGSAFFQAGRLDEAIVAYETAVRLAPRRADGHQNLGTAMVAAGRLPRAVAHYEEALRLNPALDEVRAELRRLGAAPRAP